MLEKKMIKISLVTLLVVILTNGNDFAIGHSIDTVVKGETRQFGNSSSTEEVVVAKSGEALEEGSESIEENHVQKIFTNFPTGYKSFLHATLAAISIIIVSEIGDKTFFIAVILSMKYWRILVFSGAMAALTLMTALSAGLGQISAVIPRLYVHYASVALFVIFGLKMIKEGYTMGASDQGEYDDANKAIANRESKQDSHVGNSLESGPKARRRTFPMVAFVVFEAFTMTFLAEWGDRSQLTTIVLAARENVFGVILGAVLGHAMCTLMAVLGGRFVADKISVKIVTIMGGALFLGFAIWAIANGPGDTGNISEISRSKLM